MKISEEETMVHVPYVLCLVHAAWLELELHVKLVHRLQVTGMQYISGGSTQVCLCVVPGASVVRTCSRTWTNDQHICPIFYFSLF